MRDQNLHFVFDPVRFFSSAQLLSGGTPGDLPDRAEVITDLNLAMTLAATQDPPSGYRCWPDAYALALAACLTNPATKLAESFIEQQALQAQSDLDRLWDIAPDTEFLTFWDNLAEDILAQLKMIGISRFVLGHRAPALLEDIYQTYRAGYYPCGLREDGGIVAFDPKALAGFDKIRRS